MSIWLSNHASTVWLYLSFKKKVQALIIFPQVLTSIKPFSCFPSESILECTCSAHASNLVRDLLIISVLYSWMAWSGIGGGGEVKFRGNPWAHFQTTMFQWSNLCLCSCGVYLCVFLCVHLQHNTIQPHVSQCHKEGLYCWSIPQTTWDWAQLLIFNSAAAHLPPALKGPVYLNAHNIVIWSCGESENNGLTSDTFWKILPKVPDKT